MRGASIIDSMVIDMNVALVRTLEQVRLVLAGTQALEFRRVEDNQGRYGWIEQVLRRFGYTQLSRADKGVGLAYLQRLSGYSRAQVTRLLWGSGLAPQTRIHLKCSELPSPAPLVCIGASSRHLSR